MRDKNVNTAGFQRNGRARRDFPLPYRHYIKRKHLIYEGIYCPAFDVVVCRMCARYINRRQISWDKIQRIGEDVILVKRHGQTDQNTI